MNAHHTIKGETIEVTDSWGTSVTESLERSRRTAWIVAAIASAIALLLAIALVALLPLKTVVPYTLLVDRQTGYVEELAPLDDAVVSPDTALTRSFLAQYVVARESYDASSLQRDYRKVALWSEGDARQRYLAAMNSSNPSSPVTQLANGSTVRTEISSVSSLSADSALVRFITQRSERGGQAQAPQRWAAVINFRFSGAEMSADDRLLNPLGFQVTRYRRDQETIPEITAPQPAQASVSAEPEA
ncbi:VirB8/TrbF family protein [Qipengyuania citrea]|jgi:type IV secretion system protein VirB8|uniref:VirB8/TrbF family protein n=1 Tax=Qipengyuania citrea TaxID=225971 RepID=A0ABY4UBC4_9SPHN|nr:VirB8/TrbF family protein [Qipengyuania citrea]USA61370.1 VirB8/TrbF family protein [Qipengyuania citrea]